MRRLSYANVMSTLAVFLALGGSAYAALTITGQQVVNGSLTGKDIKKKSVALNRLRGNVPNQFVPSAGLYEVAVGPGGWQSLTPNLKRSNVFGGWVSTTTNDGATLTLDPALPAETAGKAMRLRAVTPCWNATTTVAINGVVISTFRENATATATDIVEQDDPADHTEAICKRYEFSPPVNMSGGRRVAIRINTTWTVNGATIHVGGATFEFDRAQ